MVLFKGMIAEVKHLEIYYVETKSDTFWTTKCYCPYYFSSRKRGKKDNKKKEKYFCIKGGVSGSIYITIKYKL